MRVSTRSVFAAMALLPAVLALGQSNHRAAELMVGDNPPPISVAKWVKGQPVDSFEKGKVYVVEFWATWCGPCKQSIPHLTELQKKFGDKATFIGVSAFETNWDGVEPFVKSEGDQMDYNVAMDKVASATTREGDMAKTWMEAAHQNGIPTAFVIDKEGKVAWIGHPMSLEEPLSQIVGGTWDREKAAKQFAGEMESQGKMDRFQRAFGQDMKEKHWSSALKTISDNESDLPPGESDMLRMTVYSRSGDEAGYSKIARSLMEGKFKDNAMMMNQIAWTIVDPKTTFKHRDLKLARAAAEKGVELTHRKQPDVIDTLAWTYYWSGDKAKAVALENEALAEAQPSDRASLEASLETFKQ